ncbi:MAG: phosphonate ABC transporter ATP-binding protein [Burkholderiales bacterium]
MDAVNEPAIALQEAVVRYGAATALDAVSLAVRPGEFVVLLGPSGAGKSTVFRCLSGLVRPQAGEARVLGQRVDGLGARALRELRRGIGLVFQQHNLIGRLRAIDNVLTGCLAETSLWRVLARRFALRDRQLALACLDRVGLLEKAWQRADSLSGGQQQRVAIARVLAQRGRILLADEPVASLDPESARQVLGLLASVARQEGMAVLCSLHQVGLAREFADRLIGLRQGRVVFDLPAHELCDADEARLYLQAPSDGQSLLAPASAAAASDRLSPT